MRPVVYVTSAVDFDKHKSELKLRPCPHCCVVGCLIQHGYLRGHGDGSHDEVQRGWRVFCSDRHRRSGCGKTHSILLTEFIFHRMVRSAHLWQLLHNLREGLRLKAAWEKIVSPFSLDTGYRLRAAFTRSQKMVRASWAARPDATTVDDDGGKLDRIRFSIDLLGFNNRSMLLKP